MDSMMEYYVAMVPFLGSALGKHVEIALLDCRSQRIIAIANGQISGRSPGAPMTDFARSMMERDVWREREYISNYSGYAQDEMLLRSSTFFIKSGGELLGMLCINIDTSDYQLISRTALLLGGLTGGAPHLVNGDSQECETFLDNVTNTIFQVLHGIYGERIPQRFSRRERVEILLQLQEREMFLVKGAIPRTAEALHCSLPTVYRDLAKLSSWKGHSARGRSPR